MTLETLSQSSQNEMVPGPPPKKRLRTEDAASDDSALPGLVDVDLQAAAREPAESSLPPVVDEPEAVRKYEDRREPGPETGTYTSSIYVDAFELALDTVLREEAYLFSEDELEVFAKYRSLPYEAQYL